jgi:alkylation response protein AidB-like acyl-CoA dehydrogenase
MAYYAAWQRRQFEAGWAGIGWPVQYGGRGLSPVEQVIWYEELARAHAPHAGTNFVGINNVGPALMICGTEDQKKRYLEPILRGDEVWCQGFSEPDAGSDLASLRTRGDHHGDRLVVNGQKIWTSYAWAADFQQLLVRTDPSASKQRGITCVICPMDLPGIEIRPITTMAGDADFCEVFYTDVEIPVANVLGELNGGWNVVATTLLFERGTAFTAEQVALAEMVEALIDLTRTDPLPGAGQPLVHDDEIRRELGRLRTEVSALRAMTYLGVSRMADEAKPSAHGSIPA